MDDTRHRIWWCPTGALTFLPIHAAGIYSGNGQDCLANYAVSSYTPTLTALLHAREHDDRHPVVEPGRVLVIAQPNVAGLPTLPMTCMEADVIESLLPQGSLLRLGNFHPENRGDNVTVQGVLDVLPWATVLHLACHGDQVQNDPLASGFDLMDGRLAVSQLMRLSLPRAQLAYLSACESAGADRELPDETLNLAATMLFMGFKSVIGTMWKVLACITCVNTTLTQLKIGRWTMLMDLS